jgi:hypothetical protein
MKTGDYEMELTNDELKNRIIEDGIKCCKKDEYLESYEIEGIVEGFNICRDLNTPEDFINMIQSRHEKEIGMLQNSDHTVKENDEYWKYCYATLQIEFIWERMKIAWNILGTIKTNAVLHYADLVGINQQFFTKHGFKIIPPLYGYIEDNDVRNEIINLAKNDIFSLVNYIYSHRTEFGY